MKHHLITLAHTSRHGCWANCSCGWKSQLWTTTQGAHVEFGQHLAQSPTELPQGAQIEETEKV